MELIPVIKGIVLALSLNSVNLSKGGSMDYTIPEWNQNFQKILSKSPTIVKIFQSQWLQDEAKHFQNSTHQFECHPLVCLLVNCGGATTTYGFDSDLLENLFKILESDISSSKISDIKKRRLWHEFIPVFGELLIAFEMKKGKLGFKMEPGAQNGAHPDFELYFENEKIALEVNTVTENDGMRADKSAYRDDLKDAVELSRLVTKYRDDVKNNRVHTEDVKARLSEVQEYDKIWEDPTPRVFGGIPYIRSRHKSSGVALTDIRGRKKDARQSLKYKHRILGLILPTEYFPIPYAYWRLWETYNNSDSEVKYWTSGAVFNSFYGKKGEPIFNYSHIFPPAKIPFMAREHDMNNGRFMEPSLYSAALLCSLDISQGRIITPINYKFILFEPLGICNWLTLLPKSVVANLKSVFTATSDLNKVIERNFAGYLKSTILCETVLRKFENPKSKK